MHKEFRCEHHVDVEQLLSACGRVIDYIYETNLRRTRNVRLIPPELRQDIDQSTVAALMSTYTRCNRPIKRPERHAEVFGHCVKLDLERGALSLVKEDVRLPCPDELHDVEILKLSYVKVWEHEVEVHVRIRTKAFNVADVPYPVADENEGDES